MAWERCTDAYVIWPAVTETGVASTRAATPGHHSTASDVVAGAFSPKRRTYEPGATFAEYQPADEPLVAVATSTPLDASYTSTEIPPSGTPDVVVTDPKRVPVETVPAPAGAGVTTARSPKRNAAEAAA